MNNRKNNFDRTGSSEDFSNNEGYHDYQPDRQSGDFKSSSQFSGGNRSQYDDGMSRSEGNNYPRNENKNRGERPTSLNSDRYESRYSGPSSDQYESSRNYGSGSSQSERFDAQKNSNYGYGANMQDDHRNESRYDSGRSQGNQGGQSSSDTRYGFSQNFDRNAPTQGSQRGPHSGKGPKGYKRSDDRVKEDVCEVLRHHPEIDPTEVEVDVKDGLVTLSGTVDSRQTKRMAEDEIEQISGVSDIKNELRILASADTSKPRWGAAENSFDSESQTKNGGSKNQPGRNGQASGSTNNKSVQ